MKRLAGPGLFRFLLATTTVVYHFSRIAFGTACVLLFFCLSGYWIRRMWESHYSRTLNPYNTYLVSRAWRILPVFILSAIVCLGCEIYMGQPLVGLKGAVSWGRFIFSQLFILGYSQLPQKPNGPAWSLDMEAQFYLIAPLLVFAVAMARPVWLLLIAGILSFVSAYILGPGWITDYLIFFLIGMVTANTGWRPALRLVQCSMLVAGLLSAGILLSNYRQILLVGAHPAPLSAYNEHANTVIALILVPLAMYTTKQEGFVFDRALGDISYIVYLLQWAVVIVLPRFMGSGIPRLSLTILCLLMMYAASILVWRFYDWPLNRLRARWVASRTFVAAG